MQNVYYSKCYDKICYIQIDKCILFSISEGLYYELDMTDQQHADMVNHLVYLGEL